MGREIALDGLNEQSLLHCKENCQPLGLFRSVHGKEFLSFQGLGGRLLELFLD